MHAVKLCKLWLSIFLGEYIYEYLIGHTKAAREDLSRQIHNIIFFTGGQSCALLQINSLRY